MEDEMWRAPDIVPLITYADLPRAIEWLQRVFGFRERAAARLTWPGGGMTWFEAGGCLFHVSTLDESWGEPAGSCRTRIRDEGVRRPRRGSVAASARGDPWRIDVTQATTFISLGRL